MQNVLPQQAGLTVGNVFYRYTTEKAPDSAFLVTVQNEDASGNGYIFREVDDWTGLPGNTINKLVSVGEVPIERWGNGSIEGTGEGIVTDPYIVYTYQYDPCFDPQSDPSCPGYLPETPPVVEIYDPLQDQLILEELEKESYRESEEEKERQRKSMQKEQKKKERLEVALGAVNSALLTADSVAKASLLIQLNPNINSYYIKDIPGNVYNDTINLGDRKLPDNPKSKRAQLAQELLHEEMIKSQYKSSQED
jgi:hypothetical protein